MKYITRKPFRNSKVSGLTYTGSIRYHCGTIRYHWNHTSPVALCNPAQFLCSYIYKYNIELQHCMYINSLCDYQPHWIAESVNSDFLLSELSFRHFNFPLMSAIFSRLGLSTFLTNMYMYLEWRQFGCDSMHCYLQLS